jgi:hypothetical protein
MAENNYNIIKPVESLQNIAQMGPVTRRQQRKRRENQQDEHDEPQEQTETENQSQPIPEPTTNSAQNSLTIDYRA